MRSGEVLKEGRHGWISGRGEWQQKRNGGMKCAQFRYLAKWPCLRIGFSEFDCWFIKFDTSQLSDVLDKMIWMSGKPLTLKDREDGGLVGGKMQTKEREKSIKLRWAVGWIM